MQKHIGAAVYLLCVLTTTAIAQFDPATPLSARSIARDDTDGFGGIAGPGEFSVGFEAGEGFFVGPLEPQNGFSASGTNAAWASVSEANPGAGLRHLRMVRDPDVARGTTRVALTPDLGPLPDGPSITSMLINISNFGGADYDVVGQAPSQGLLTWRVKFNFDNGLGAGNIQILDDVGSGLEFIDTGIAWTAGQYRPLRVEVDFDADAIRYYYSGALIYQSQAGVFAGTRVEQIGWVNDNLQLTNETADIDELVLTTPEPGTIILSMIGLAALRRR